MSYQQKYNTFRLTFPEFVYESYHYDVQSDGLHIAFRFRLNDNLIFEPTAFIPARLFYEYSLCKEQMDILVFNIGMVELISYWKAFCPPVVRVLPHGLSPKQVAFWKKLYYNGLGEFFYVNGIRATERNFMTIVADGTALQPCAFPMRAASQYIVPIGGGKDSVVTLDMLSQIGSPLPLVMNPRGATLECCRVAGFGRTDFIEIQRLIHPLLLDLNAKGALNGHTPFSAMLAFYTLLASALVGRPNIALSNESSANEATVVGSNVNHQYSKSLEFENDFRAYVSEFVSPSFNYFSFLRPLSELQIAMLFARLPQFHEVFRSCNVGSKQDVWCGHCAKCLFAFIILSPFLPIDKLMHIFGHNLLDDESLRIPFRQLTGLEPTKPFECVGTIAEVHTALRMFMLRNESAPLPLLLRDFAPSDESVPLHGLRSCSNLNAVELSLIESHVL